MGKKKNKKRSSTFEYMSGTGKIGKMMDRYDIEGAKYGRPDRGGTQRSMDDVDKDIAKAMMNDYDTRRGMEAAAMAGDKKAKRFAKKGFKAGSIYDGYSALEHVKKKYVGGGGMTGAKNQAGLSYAAVKADREKFIEDNDDKYASKDDLKKHKAKSVEEQVEEAQYEPSDRIKAAKERVAAHKEGSTAYGDNQAQREEASESFGRFKLKLSTMK